MSGQSFITLRKLTTYNEEPIEHIVRRAGEELRGFAAKATIQLRLIGVGKEGAKRAYSILIKPDGASPHAEAATPPDLAISTGAETFRLMAGGSYSPVQAYLDGKMYLRGNVDLGKRILVHLAGSGTDFEGCLSLETHWFPPTIPGKANGTLTGLGRNFTPGGLYDVKFNFLQVDPPLPERGTVNAAGQFSFTTSLECDPDGVDISAFDIATGESLNFTFATPCKSVAPMTLDVSSTQLQTATDLTLSGTSYTPGGHVTITIRDVPGSPPVLQRSAAGKPDGTLEFFESFPIFRGIPTVPFVTVTVRDDASNREIAGSTSSGPFATG